MLASEIRTRGYTSAEMGGPSPGSFRFLVSLVALALLSSGCSGLLPDLQAEEEGAPPLAQTSKIYDADGRLITTLHAEEDRVPISIRQIPQNVQDAVVAIEDHRFWTHRGIDLRAVLRAAYVNATSGQVVEGGSTITQQYVRNVFPSVGRELTIGRKLREAALAWQLEEEYSKREILGKYLNTVYFGQGAYGIQRAAKSFYSKPAWELNLAESALLAGLIAGPARYDPLDDRARARERRDLVLRRMLDLGMISPRRYDRAASTTLGLDPKPEREQYQAAYFVDYVKRLILDNPRFGTPTQRYNFLFKGGLRIYTTIDLEMQRLAEHAVEGVLSVSGDPHGALTAVDPRTGHIRAMVGGRNYFNPQSRFAKVNLATGQGGTGRQAGSAFKPFALVAALEQGILPSKVYQASSSRVFTQPPCGSPEDPWNVQNYEGSGYGSMTMESATINSVNVVYAQIIEEVGPANVVDVARRMGIRSPLRPYCSSVLGTNEVNSLEMASAFGTLAMNGRRVRPIAIQRIEDSEGKTVYEPRVVRRQVINPQVAWIATQILRKVVLSGTGYAANLTGRQVAGKTGTAQMWRDAWFVGFVPQLSAAVWVGHPQGQISMTGTRVGNVTGGSFPASIWAAFMRSVIANMHFPVREFRAPAVQTISVPIDVTQGCVAVQGVTPADHVQYRQFVPGTQPPQCSAAAASSVPSVIGMSASTAYSILTNAGFNVSQSLRETNAYPTGTVLGQSPSPGSDAPPGSTVSIVVAS
jgi:penicillin-binding protein 1A